MNQQPNQNHRKRDEEDLRQTLLELHYGLLDETEQSELESQIHSDPRVSQLWNETRVVAGKFAEAAKADANESTATVFAPPSVSPQQDLDRTDSVTRNHVAARDPLHDDVPNGSTHNRFLRLWLGTLATAAALSIVVCGLRYWQHRPESPTGNVRLAVKPVAGQNAASRNDFLVVLDDPAKAQSDAGSYDTSLSIVPATISFKVLSEGAVLFFGKAESGESGAYRIRVPDDVAIPSNAVLHVNADPNSDDGGVRLTVPLEPTRCLTFVSTDKPVYRPGESIFFRSVTLNRRTLAAHLDVPIRYELIDPSGAAVEGSAVEGITERGVGNGALIIPDTAPGGPYQLVAKSLDGFFPDEICEIEIRRYRSVRLKTDLEFSKRSYSAGDRVEAKLVVRRADDSIPSAASARIQATVDGNVVHQSSTTLDIDGTLSIVFDLPRVLREGSGTLSVAIDDGAITETAARPIPIHTGRVQVEFFPEGGYLVGGVDNRVYFSARDLNGKPIDVEGEILSQAGRMVASLKTVRDGMGRFTFKPESGQRYSLRITSPIDITETPWLPSAVEALPVLDTGLGVFESDEPISMVVRSTKRRSCIVRAVCRGELVGVQTLDLEIGETPISVPIQERAAGVIRVTVLSSDEKVAKPLVERLVYRKTSKELKITARVDDGQLVHQPGQSVRMTLEVTDENDQLVPGAVLGVSVVDDAALSLQQTEAPTIKTHFLLTSEIQSPQDLEHANFYLSDSFEAAESLDLLLGTQGWRRFVSGTPTDNDESFRSSLIRLIELDGQRAGLSGKIQTNDASLAELVRSYQLQLTTAWSKFLSEVRFVLIMIGVIWLIGFVIRPRKSTLAAAGILLCVVFLAHAGCGASHEMAESTSVSNRGGQEFSDKLASGAEEQLRPNQLPPSMDELAQPVDANEGDGMPADEAYVQRVVRKFLGQSASKTFTFGSHHRLTQEQLDRWAKSRDLDAQALADQLMEELRLPIRQYAHLHRPSEDDVRSDFAETLYWNPIMVTDSTGTATIRFDLSDSLTLFRVKVDGHSADGRLGSGGGTVVTQLPIQVEPKLPLEVTSGDRIDLPIGLVNSTSSQNTVHLAVELDAELVATRSTAVRDLRAGQRETEVFPINVNETLIETDSTLRVSASDRNGIPADRVNKTVRIVPSGFPFDVSQSGTLSGTTPVSSNLPASIIPGSLNASVKLYPSTRSQLSAGLDSILREPHGCFEQASASNYPNVMAFQMMKLDGAVDDRTEKRTISLLRRGYRKLTSYECATLGYEWFGNDPGHEALSAFGLMQFSEMAKFIDVDPSMLSRTRDWLHDRRNGNGGFQRNPRHLHAWSVKQEVVNAYLLWAISQADRHSGNTERTVGEFESELNQMWSVARESDDPYLVALSAITLLEVGRADQAKVLLDRLTDWQAQDGSLKGQTTITQSGGLSRTVETTSLGIMAWSHRSIANHAAYRSASQNAAKWLLNHRQGGGFGSTQATVLALKALIAVRDQFVGNEGGSVDVRVDGQTVDTIHWQGRPADGIQWPLPADLCRRLVSDPNVAFSLRNRDESTVPFCVQFAGRTTMPQSNPNCPLSMDLSFGNAGNQTSVRSGDSVEVIAEVSNITTTGRPMSVAVIGLPGGLEPVIESLDQLRDEGSIDYYELRGREVVLYWRTFAPQESKRIAITCTAAVGGRYTAPPSRVYLYYTAESKFWHEPLIVHVNH